MSDTVYYERDVDRDREVGREKQTERDKVIQRERVIETQRHIGGESERRMRKRATEKEREKDR